MSYKYDYLSTVSNWEAKKTLAVIKEAQNRKTVHRFHRRGWSNDKEKTMRAVARIPLWVLAHPEYGKYFQKDHVYEDRRKEQNAFFKLDHIETPWGEKISPQAFLEVDRL